MERMGYPSTRVLLQCMISYEKSYLVDFVPKSHIKHVTNIKQSNAGFQKIVHSVKGVVTNEPNFLILFKFYLVLWF